MSDPNETPSPPEGDEPSQRSPLDRVRTGAPWLSLAAVLVWAGQPAWGWLLLVFGFGAAGLLGGLTARPLRRVACGVLIGTSVVAAVGQRELGSIRTDFEGYWAERRIEAEDAVNTRLDVLLVRGENALDRVAEARAGDEGVTREQLSGIRRATGLAAIALYGPDGSFELWDGRHQGFVPDPVRRGVVDYSFRDRPLYSYLYFTRILEDGSVAVAAALMRSGLPEAVVGDESDFTTAFTAATGERVRLFSPERAFGPSILDLTWNDRPILSVTVVTPTQIEREALVLRGWQRTIVGLAAIAWLLLVLAGPSRSELRWAVQGLPLLFAALVPLEVFAATGVLFAEGTMALWIGEISFDRAVLVALAAAVGVAAMPVFPGRAGAWVTALAVALVYPVVDRLTGSAADAAFLSGSDVHWFSYQLALAVMLSLAALAAFRWVRPQERPHGGWDAGLAGLGLLVVWVLGAWYETTSGTTHAWLLAFWAIPAFFAARFLAGKTRVERSWLALVLSAMIGGSAAQVHTWGHRIEALRVEAERALGSLGVQDDPDAEGHFARLLQEVRALDEEGADDRFILFDAWTRSGLATAGTEAWLSIWNPDGTPAYELPLGIIDERPSAATDYLREPLFGPEVRPLRETDALILARAPLRDGRVFTAVQPPRRDVGIASPLATLVGGVDIRTGSPLTLVETPASGEGDRSVSWERAADGWRARTVVEYPDGYYEVRYDLELPRARLLLVRALLVLLADLGVLALVWGLGQAVLGRRGLPVARWRPFATFRARVTVALFAFFLFSNAIFGALLLRTLNGATERTATALASRVVTDAAAFYTDMNRSMARLSERVGAELLEYRDGELRGGSADELIELGLYDGWVPMQVQDRLEAGSDEVATALSSLGSFAYLDAFQLLPDGDVVATLVPLEAGTTALRGREVAELIGLITILGVGLSFGLALLVGRTLTRPMQTLRTASERVGAGDLDLRLPNDRADEFGAVFGAFNRMVLRIQRARRALERTTRRTQAIVEEVATGVIALDPDRNVTLINPRAQALMGGLIEVGGPLQGSAGPRRELVEWAEAFMAEGLREATTELQFGDRRIRVRGRQISREGAGGLVISLEDVTDELRTERVLAWGEMARQVAHEVKNPLTPIKLSVQHLRRAWTDRPEDFEPVLERNVEVILAEIDRLDSIARSFSKFGAPEEPDGLPLEKVDVQTVVRDVLALYVASEEGAIRFSSSIPEDLPWASARATELKEVLLNLLENARAAIDGPGRVVIEALYVPDQVEVRVRDDGSGISPELLGRIFEPRFSTRSTGTGLGLAIVRRVVESWGGTVTAESGRGEGTVIRIRLVPWRDAT